MPVIYARLGQTVISSRIYARRSVRERLLERLVIDLNSPGAIDGAPCWLVPGKPGYATIARGGRNSTALAHRVAYELWFGPIPAGLDIDHLCRNRRCCNPAHLDAVTRSVNLRRGKHGGGPKPGYRHRPETIEKLRQAALLREARRRVPWSAEWRAS